MTFIAGFICGAIAVAVVVLYCIVRLVIGSW